MLWLVTLALVLPCCLCQCLQQIVSRSLQGMWYAGLLVCHLNTCLGMPYCMVLTCGANLPQDTGYHCKNESLVCHWVGGKISYSTRRPSGAYTNTPPYLP